MEGKGKEVMEDEVKMVKVTFHMGTGICKKSETFEVENYVSAEDLGEDLRNWVMEHSNSYFTEE